MDNRTLSEQIIGFMSDLKIADIPSDAISNAKYHVLDTIGICLASTELDTVKAAKNVMDRLGTRLECTAIGFREKYSAPAAAMINSVGAHGADFDDTHSGSILHISSTVVPTSIAVAESVGASGKDFITAATVGYELATRLGMTAPGKFTGRGWHPSAMLGIFGVALITGKLKGLPPAVMRDALGICGSQASGIIEFLHNGSNLKQIQPGWACYSGITSTMFAEAGVTGPDTVFEGEHGVFKCFMYGQDMDLSAPVAGLGTTWEVNNIAYKLHPCCHYNQAFVDCVKVLKHKNDFRLEEIEEVECIIHPKQAEVVVDPIEEKIPPKTAYDGKFSLPYVVSVALLRDKVTLKDFTDEAVKDKNAERLARKFKITHNMDTGFPFTFPGWVKIKLKDGRILEHIMKSNRGGVGNPADDSEIIGKFEDNASLMLPSAKINRIKEMVLNIEDVKDIREITENMQF